MKLFIAAVVMSALSMPSAWAEQTLDGLLACRRVPDPVRRLECFDRASEAPLAARRPDPVPSPTKPAAVESSIVRVSKPVMGRVDFSLDNGQVWRQTDADVAMSAKVGDQVAVSKTFLGAYWLTVESGHKWRVTLVR
jgi:hypothetical protein